MFQDVYRGTRVLLTGDTGFKGAWLAWWLHRLGAEVNGLALPPVGETLFEGGDLQRVIQHSTVDICDRAAVEHAVQAARPRIIFHLAAQALVRDSYANPVETMMTNVMGTAHICDALRRVDDPCALVVVTSDKCYENREWVHGYRETDAMGGSDPYSASKGAAELVTSSWRRSFFPVANMETHGKPVATARAGNVIGPGDWAKDRIVPDTLRALLAGEPVRLRNPHSIRPWQHVLEPLSGYLALGAGLLNGQSAAWAEGWNFGPLPGNVRTVRELAEGVIAAWGFGSWENTGDARQLHEANLLRLSIDQAVARMNWGPVWNFEQTVRYTALGYQNLRKNAGDPEAVRRVMTEEIERYVAEAKALDVKWAQK